MHPLNLQMPTLGRSVAQPALVHPPSCISQHRRLRRACIPRAAAGTVADSLRRIEQLKSLVVSVPSLSTAQLKAEPRRVGVSDAGDRVSFVATQEIGAGAEIFVIGEESAVTQLDAEKHELVGELAANSSELVALTLWLLAERAKGAQSQWSSLLASMPDATLSPLLWSDDELNSLLSGSPTLAEAKSRRAVLEQQWQDLETAAFSKDRTKFPSSVFGQQQFMQAFTVILAHALYLPSAGCFALLPVASTLGRTGSEGACTLDYVEDRKAVVVKATRPMRSGSEVLLYDPRPNGELLLATGAVPDTNPSDYLLWDASLVQADRYFMMKSQILESLGFSAKEQFPVYADRFPQQLLSYLRLARVADPALFAKVSFDQDIVLSQMNEYEILQLLMGDCREKLQVYQLSNEEDIKLSQQRDLSPKERLACKLRLSERKIINATMEAVRRRLAPIRGIPTKAGGMQDPNSDIREIFDVIESIPTAPVKLVEGFLSWARGEQDPDWGKKPDNKPKGPRPW